MMIGLLGDCHFTGKVPVKRIDDYVNTQKTKFSQALSIFNDYKCSVVLQTGDMFDSPNVSNMVISWVIKYLIKNNLIINMVFGNHCIWGHSSSTLLSSPLSVLESANVIRLLNSNGHKIDISKSNITLYGAGFGENIPKPINTKDYNILVTHSMIGNRQLYIGQELEDPIRFLKKYNEYNLVVCGHYHYRFVSEYNGRFIINPGQLLRSTVSKFDLEHIPAVVLFNTETNEIIIEELKVRPVEEVFNLKEEDDSSNGKESFKNLIHKLKSANSCHKIGWKHKLISIMNEMNCSNECRKIIDEFMEKTGVKKSV